MHRLIAGLFALTIAAQSNAQDAIPMYVGTYTKGDSEGIYRLQIDRETGEMTGLELAAETVNPSFLAEHPILPVLYAVGEMGDDGPGGTVSAWRMDPATGKLTLINQQSSVGGGPCHVAVTPSGDWVGVANYGGGSTAFLPVNDDGRLGEAAHFFQHEGSSVHPRQKAPHAHSVTFNHDGTHAFAADLGIDKLMIFAINDAGEWAPGDPAFAPLDPGSGPRHTKVHPSGDYVYAVNELGNTVTAFAVRDPGVLEAIQTIGTLPESFDGDNTTAEIRVHPSGKFLYASNRGHDSIASFAIDQKTGELTATGHTPTGGETPRNFNVEPFGRCVVVANQNTDNVVSFHVNPDDGTLSPTGHSIAVPTPVCVLFPRARP